jgi:hypothetical protein
MGRADGEQQHPSHLGPVAAFAGFRLCGGVISPNDGERSLYPVGFQMSRNSKNKNATRTTIFRGSNTQLSVL